MRGYLVGYMASGKTTIGERLAARLGVSFVDTDAEIERSTNRSIAEIFDQDGEGAFRDLEYEVLKGTQELADVVVATGGGAMASRRNRELLVALGTTYWLDVPWQTIAERLSNSANQDRPLARDLDRAKQLFVDRQRHYQTAHHRIRVTATDSVAAVAARIRRLLEAQDALPDSF